MDKSMMNYYLKRMMIGRCWLSGNYVFDSYADLQNWPLMDVRQTFAETNVSIQSKIFTNK